MTTDSNQARATIGNDWIVAVIFLAFSAALAFLVRDEQLRLRLFGIGMGVFVAYYGNLASKTLTPLARLRGDPAQEQSLRRFTAWSLTLAGLAYIITYLVFPPDQAVMIATGLLGFATILIVIRTVRMRRRGLHR